MLHITQRSVLPLAIVLTSAVIACDDDPIPLAPVAPNDQDTLVVTATPPADVNGLFQTLPSWEEYSAPVSDAEVVATEPSFYEQSGEMFCSVTEAIDGVSESSTATWPPVTS